MDIYLTHGSIAQAEPNEFNYDVAFKQQKYVKLTSDMFSSTPVFSVAVMVNNLVYYTNTTGLSLFNATFMLYSTKTGKAISALEHAAHRMKHEVEDKVDEYSNEVQDKAKEIYDEASDIAEEGIERGKEIIDGAREKVQNVTDQYKNETGDFITRAEEVIGEVEKEVEDAIPRTWGEVGFSHVMVVLCLLLLLAGRRAKKVQMGAPLVANNEML